MLKTTNYNIQNTKYKIHDRNTEYRIQNTEYKIQDTKYKIQNTRHKIQHRFVADENQIEVRQNAGDEASPLTCSPECPQVSSVL